MISLTPNELFDTNQSLVGWCYKRFINNYNHPHKETLDNLNSRNIKIYRTDIDGTIKLISDGNNIEFKKLETSIDG